MNNHASDDSLKASSTSAMVAIMNLSALNIPGAFSNGYKAYGQYLNSEKLDDMEAHAKENKGRLASMGAGGAASQSTEGARPTTFSRLDPSYLHEGQASEVAAEFEKRSGMSRDEFLHQLGSATDSDLTYEDPDLMQKLDARFNAFTQSIPNEGFRKGLKAAKNMVPASMRQEALNKLASLYNETWKDAPPAANGEAPVFTAANTPVAPASAPAEETPPAERAPASETPAALAGKNGGMLLGIDQDPDALRDLLGSADNSDEGALTIFEKVSRRYRLLSPALIGKR
jgi:hypothetical protein